MDVHSYDSFIEALRSTDNPINITLTDSFHLMSTVFLPEGKAITIISGEGGPYTISRDAIVPLHLLIIPADTSLSLHHVIIDGNKDEIPNAPGTLIYNNGELLLYNGTVLQNNRVDTASDVRGGGVINNGEMRMNTGSMIRGNHAPLVGGIYNAGTLTMNDDVVVSDNSGGSTGGIYNAGSLFINNSAHVTNNSGDSGGGIYSDSGIFHILSGEVSGNHATNGGGIYLASGDPLEILGRTQITGNTATNDGGGIYTPYENLANIDVDRDATFSGNRAAQAYQIDPADIPLHDAHILTHTFSNGFPYGYNNFDIAYNNGYPTVSVEITVKKTASGKTLEAGQFAFGLLDASSELLSSVTNDADGNITFPAITFDDVGAYSYTIYEITQSGGGWTTDTHIVPVTVTVTMNEQEQLVADVAYGSDKTFRNTYRAAPVNVTLRAAKETIGAVLEAGQFEFGLHDSAGTLLSTAYNDAEGNITFPTLTYDVFGTYVYNIREETKSSGGWTTDTHRIPVTVTVADDGQGQLVADVTYEGDRTFRNTYGVTPVSIMLRATKRATGAELKAEQFTFELTDDSSGHKTFASNDPRGNIIFPVVTFDNAGTYDYRIREISQSGGGWTTDTHIVPVIITVTDDGGNLSAKVTYPNGQPIFMNTYNPAPVGVALRATVRIIGVEAPIYYFDFGLFEHPKAMLAARRVAPSVSDEPGILIATASNDAEGNVVFPPLTFDTAQIGTHDYTIREISPSGEGWIVDGRAYPAIITVSDTGQGKLVAAVAYPEGEPIFINTYQTASVTAQIHANTCVCGCCCLCAGWFSFGLFNIEGKRVAIAANDENGNILFSLPFDVVGIYTYTLRELDNGLQGWMRDKHVYQVTVTVTDNSQGQLVATVAYSGGNAPTFANFYEPGGTCGR
jgi:pilin isopeptide linkage protein